MGLKIRHGDETYLFGDREPDDRVLYSVRFLDRDEAHRFFGTIAADPEAASMFRRSVLGTRGRMANDGESHDAFVSRIAGDLASGHLPVSVVHSPRSNWATVAEAPRDRSAPGAALTPTSLRERPRTAEPSPRAPEPEELALDVAQQVEALVAAATVGAPFCEQCAGN
jgi:hypothetical protein